MKEEVREKIETYLFYAFVIGVSLLVVYVFLMGDLFFISGGGIVDDCVPNPVWGGCDL